nr:protein translocase subunit SecD [uncultured Tolumonas sp.]
MKKNESLIKNRMSKWQYAILALIFITFSFYSLPTFFGERPALGLHYEQAWAGNDKNILQENQISPETVIQSEDKTLLVFSSQADQQRAKQLLELNGYDGSQLTLEFFSDSPGWMQSLGAAPIRLGLDLRGGSQLLMAVDTDFIVKNHTRNFADTLRTQFKKEKLRGTTITANNDEVQITLPTTQEISPWLKIIRQETTGQTNPWVSQREDNRITLRLSETERNTLINNGVTQNLSILKKRINELGIVEASVQRQGQNGIRIELPGVHNPKQAKDVIGATASLAFYQVSNTGSYQLQDKSARSINMMREPVLSGEHIVDARASADEMGRPQVSIVLDKTGGDKMNWFSRNNVGQAMSTVFTEYKNAPDGSLKANSQVINVATIQTTLGNQFRITGLDSLSEAQELSMLLRAGALTAPLKILEERSIGPTLGMENIKAGFSALAFGMVGMMLFMLVWYRRFGWVAIVALITNLLMQVGLLALLPGAVLTLPGIAGLVLTVGMAVDTNVLIFERIKDRLREGGSLANAIDFGYRSAFVTIFDANITTLISAIVLYSIGSGPLQGFAITLILGLISSMITGVWGTRAVINPIWGRSSLKLLRV